MRASKYLLLITVSAALAASPAFAKPAKSIKDDTETAQSQNWDLEDKNTAFVINDPWENVNRGIFDFNLGFDKHIAKPVIEVYDIAPNGLRRAIGNFLSNLSEPLNAIHGVLQLNPKVAFTSLWRFILDSTFGLGGFHNFAGEYAGLPNMSQNLGKTLGRWGVDAGPYVVIPVIGPSSVRDLTGKVGDWFLDPVGWEINSNWTIAQSVANGIDARDSKASVIEHLYYQSLDPYVATRSAYRQHESFEDANRN